MIIFAHFPDREIGTSFNVRKKASRRSLVQTIVSSFEVFSSCLFFMRFVGYYVTLIFESFSHFNVLMLLFGGILFSDLTPFFGVGAFGASGGRVELVPDPCGELAWL